MVKIERPDFDQPRERDGFRCSRAGIGRQAGAERLGVSLWEVPPGQAAYPYHAHLTEEELVIVLHGRPSLAHQIVNRTDRRPDGDGLRVWFRREDERDYWEGESPPG